MVLVSNTGRVFCDMRIDALHQWISFFDEVADCLPVI